MWVVKKIEQQNFLFNISHDVLNKFVDFSCCNSLNVWYVKLTEDNIIDNFQSLNPLIQGKKDELISDILSMFDTNKTEVQWNASIMEDQLILNLTRDLGIISFLFNVTFKSASSKSFYQLLVLPLLLTINTLQILKNNLCDTLKKKDLEISEYKHNGATLSRKNMETSQFQEESLSELTVEHLKSTVNWKFEKLINESLILHLNEITKSEKKYKGQIESSSEHQKRASSPKQMKLESGDTIYEEKFVQSTCKTENTRDVKPICVTDAFLNAQTASRKPKTGRRLKNL